MVVDDDDVDFFFLDFLAAALEVDVDADDPDAAADAPFFFFDETSSLLPPLEKNAMRMMTTTATPNATCTWGLSVVTDVVDMVVEQCTIGLGQ